MFCKQELISQQSLAMVGEECCKILHVYGVIFITAHHNAVYSYLLKDEKFNQLRKLYVHPLSILRTTQTSFGGKKYGKNSQVLIWHSYIRNNGQIGYQRHMWQVRVSCRMKVES